MLQPLLNELKDLDEQLWKNDSEFIVKHGKGLIALSKTIGMIQGLIDSDKLMGAEK
jgi:hypothetical protein